MVPLSITLPISCNPSENEIPSRTVGTLGKVERTRFPSIPFSKGVYFLGSNVSVCAMPPAIHSNITVSAVLVSIGFDPAQLVSSEDIGAPAARAAKVACEAVFKNSRLFHAFIISLNLNLLINQLKFREQC